jgi:hypothetical protein
MRFCSASCAEDLKGLSVYVNNNGVVVGPLVADAIGLSKSIEPIGLFLGVAWSGPHSVEIPKT